MADSGDEEDDQVLAKFLESEILQEEEEEEKEEEKEKENWPQNSSRASKRPRIEQEDSSGIFLKIPPELFHHIFKFLSSEDLIACSLVCRFMNSAAADERLWRRLYCMRWGMGSPTAKLRACAWKQLYIQVSRVKTAYQCIPQYVDPFLDKCGKPLGCSEMMELV